MFVSLWTLDYFRQRAALTEEWVSRDAYAFLALTPGEQLDIHCFFEPTLNLLPEEVVAHRKRVTAADPSLPQRACRAFARMKPFLEYELPPRTAPSTNPKKQPRATAASRKWTAKNRRVHAFSQVNPHLDPVAFAQTLLRAAANGPPVPRPAKEEQRDKGEKSTTPPRTPDDS